MLVRSLLKIQWAWIGWCFFLCHSVTGAPFAFFSPPAGWQVSDPLLFNQEVKIGFVQSHKKIFSPAISLTIEKVGKAKLKTYLQAVRKNHRLHHHHGYRELGFLKTKSGKVHLSLIDQASQWGPLRIMQAISIHDGHAVIQTATALKKDFPAVRKDILESFRSLTLAPSVVESLADRKKRSILEEKVKQLHKEWETYQKGALKKGAALFFNSPFQQNVWQNFVKTFTRAFTDQEACWQLLAIQAIQSSLLKLP
ncbi:MAG: hypothetical protein AAF443_04300 [Chlamydiota bacterium]